VAHRIFARLALSDQPFPQESGKITTTTTTTTTTATTTTTTTATQQQQQQRQHTTWKIKRLPQGEQQSLLPQVSVAHWIFARLA